MRIKSFQPLGIGGATPGYGRHLAAFIVDAESSLILVDCGEGTQFQMNKFGIKKHKISKIFITHLHGDHYYGLVGLMTTMLLERRLNPLTIYAPKGLKEIIQIQLNIDLEAFTYPVDFVIMDEQFFLEEDGIIISSCPLDHGIEAYGYKFEDVKAKRNIHKEFIELYNLSVDQILDLKKGLDIHMDGLSLINSELTYIKNDQKSLAICTDTAYSKKLIPFLKDIDLVYHEATFLEEDRIKATKTNHSTTMDSANIALKANAKKLIVGHISLRYATIDKHNEEIQSIFPNAEVAEEGKVYDV